MGQINKEFLERYQKIWASDPTSKVFAPLAEAYRQNGQLQQALQICRQGLNQHPHFAGGWYQLAKILIDRENPEKAMEALQKAVNLAPENLQAHNMLADLYLADKQPKEALKAFKMVLLLNPHDMRAKKIIERLESLTADEYSAETFQIESHLSLEGTNENFDETGDENEEFIESRIELETSPSIEEKSFNRLKGALAKKSQEKERALAQTITLVDALLVRNEFIKAKAVIGKATRKWGESEELDSLLHIIEQQKDKSFESEAPEIIPPVPPRAERLRLLKIEKLERLLQKLK